MLYADLQLHYGNPHPYVRPSGGIPIRRSMVYQRFSGVDDTQRHTCKKHNDEYTRYLTGITRFGFAYHTAIDRWSNERYPLFCEYFSRFVVLAKERKKNLGGYLARLDFRLFADKIKLNLEDLLRPLSDRDQEFCLEMHNTPSAYPCRIIYIMLTTIS